MPTAHEHTQQPACNPSPACLHVCLLSRWCVCWTSSVTTCASGATHTSAWTGQHQQQHDMQVQECSVSDCGQPHGLCIWCWIAVLHMDNVGCGVGFCERLRSTWFTPCMRISNLFHIPNRPALPPLPSIPPLHPHPHPHLSPPSPLSPAPAPQPWRPSTALTAPDFAFLSRRLPCPPALPCPAFPHLFMPHCTHPPPPAPPPCPTPHPLTLHPPPSSHGSLQPPRQPRLCLPAVHACGGPGHQPGHCRHSHHL
jgi:hypothetical protein